MEIFVAFGRVERIKKVWQAHNKTNTFYFCFASAESAALAKLKTNNLDVLGHKLISSIQDVINLTDEENGYVPECDTKIFLSQDSKFNYCD